MSVLPVAKTNEIGHGNDSKAKITFKEPQRAITPGQAAVFYEGDIVLGGIIDKPSNDIGDF